MFAKLFLAHNGKGYCLACHTGKCSTRHNIQWRYQHAHAEMLPWQ
ncbi:Uncharacterised protein [Enterobacter cancerogenus]|uniref:Uncharacterized protein n=1 Tax=Enterobacter cancerogenus TaxID=69218 RepID=A0A484Z9Y7_9ENTR|nr:Uncharacterised protein [Enterobacter cancerogenus]